MEGPASLISKIHDTFYNGMHFASPISSLRVNEFDLVRGLLQILQGNSSSLFIWDNDGRRFNVKVGIYIAHLSISSLDNILNQFLYTASCLRLVGDRVSKTEMSVNSPPTLRAFSSSASAWLKRLRDIALKEEAKIIDSNTRTIPTLLGLANTLSGLCSGAEYLLQIVYEAIPHVYLESISCIPAAEVTVHILDHLYKKLHEVCLVQGGEEEAYRMLIYLFVGSSLPYMETLDSWLYEGILNDPFNELFFYENKAVSIDDAEFWEKRYLLRSLHQQKFGVEFRSQSNLQTCPLFIKEMAKAIVSAGKSLQLIRHFPFIPNSSATCSGNYLEIDDHRNLYGAADFGSALRWHITAGLTLPEVFCVSLAGLVGHGDHVFSKLQQYDFHSLTVHSVRSEKEIEEGRQMSCSVAGSQKIWLQFLADAFHGKQCASKADNASHGVENEGTGLEQELPVVKSFCPENPVITVSQLLLHEKRDARMNLNLPKNIQLPPLNDEDLRESVFRTESGMTFSARGTDCVFGFQFDESEYSRSQDDRRVLTNIFPFPTILPSFEEDHFMSELLPFQKNSTLSSKFLTWIKVADPKATPLPAVIIDECLVFYIKRQVDYIGGHMLSKLLREWRLMDELAVLRAIYLLGSGDLLQHFFTIIFGKLDKGESWDDDFELNMILQESITNSADRMLLSAPDSLIVTLAKPHDVDSRDQNISNNLVPTPRRSHDHNLGINGLDALDFSYKVSWPLELIANSEAIKKYNQVMRFLLKVKRAKFVLDKARKWIWKERGTVTVYSKHHWLVEQKLLHFVDAFHQYVMDRVYCSAWRELCKGMAAARSLDEVMQVHDAYLLSIQRQCFVVPDKLWALIASRINTILGLALDFYSIQQTLNSGGAVSAIKARCVMEVDRIEKQFDDCITFLLRVLSFKLNVGHFPHLADLVTRINYNYYYMSDSGNMITAPRSEGVKLQKTFPRTTG